MTQYAVAAGKLPITLLHDQDGSGFLLNSEEAGVFYQDATELIEDAKKMLTDNCYLRERERQIKHCLMTELRFEEEIGYILKNKKGTFNLTVIDIDVRRIHEEYLSRFSNEVTVNSIAKFRNKPLMRYFPLLFLKRKFHRCKGD